MEKLADATGGLDEEAVAKTSIFALLKFLWLTEIDFLAYTFSLFMMTYLWIGNGFLKFLLMDMYPSPESGTASDESRGSPDTEETEVEDDADEGLEASSDQPARKTSSEVET